MGVLSGFSPPGSFPQDGTCDLGERCTAGDRSAPMACGPNVDQARPPAGAATLRIADLAWQGDPRRLPPTSEPRPGDRLVRGSPGGVRARDIPLYRRAVPDQRHGDTPTLYVFKPQRTAAGWPTWPCRPLPYQACSRDAFKLVQRSRPAHRASEDDRGCPLVTELVRLMWHASGTRGRAGSNPAGLRHKSPVPLPRGPVHQAPCTAYELTGD
jgi:hypothetical protein